MVIQKYSNDWYLKVTTTVPYCIAVILVVYMLTKV